MIEGTVHWSDSGAIIVSPVNGQAATFELTNILRATFSSGPFLTSGGVLQNGWAAQDLGDARGGARLEGDVFSLRVEGQSTNLADGHFVSRAMHSDGEIKARVESVGGPAARAGVMIRGRSSSVFAALTCDPGGKIWFDRRTDPDRREVRSLVVATMPPPVWLRLRKQDKYVTAHVSMDGENWQTVARDTTKLLLERTWRDHEGELYLLRASFGLFAASRAKDTVCTAQVAQVAMTLNGLVGQYFADADFKNLAFARLDPQVRFDWRTSAPEGIAAEHDFSVRWTGTLIPPKTGRVTFYCEGDDRARLWINGEEIEAAAFRRILKGVVSPAPPPRMTLVAGMPLDLKLEFADRARPASVKLNWDWFEGRPEVVAMTNFVFDFHATNSPDEAAFRRNNNSPVVRGVILRDGTFLAGAVNFADESAVKVTIGKRRDMPVLNSRVARIVVRPPRQSLVEELAAGKTGAFLKSGDFFESEFHGIEHGALQMSSVLFGLKRYWVENGDVSVVVLGELRPVSFDCEVRTLDGSVLRATRVSLGRDELVVEEPLLGPVIVPATEVWEIRRGPLKSG